MASVKLPAIPIFYGCGKKTFLVYPPRRKDEIEDEVTRCRKFSLDELCTHSQPIQMVTGVPVSTAQPCHGLYKMPRFVLEKLLRESDADGGR
jgi:hypothetical protein